MKTTSCKVAANVAAFREQKEVRHQIFPHKHLAKGGTEEFLVCGHFCAPPPHASMARAVAFSTLPPPSFPWEMKHRPALPGHLMQMEGAQSQRRLMILLTSQLHLPPTSPPHCLGPISRFYIRLPHLILKTFSLVATLGKASASEHPKATLPSDK